MELKAGVGIDGNVHRGGRRQVTLISWEAWEDVARDLDVDVDPVTRRANLLVEGLPPLADTLGARLRIGEVLLEVTEETAPCRLMDRFHQGLRAALTPDWRGGVTCRVVSGGRLRLGDAAGFE